VSISFDLAFTEGMTAAAPNITSLGLRFETQNDIHGPRRLRSADGFGWGLGRGKVAQDRPARRLWHVSITALTQSYLLNAERLNGINQQESFYIAGCLDSFPTIHS